jgi:Uma2 family endonuclease
MATVPIAGMVDNGYPTGDGKPMAETDWHRILMTRLIEMLIRFFSADPRVYVSGNLLVFYEQGNRRRHVSPDVFMVRGVEKHLRPNYLVWEEGRGPEVVIELTSSSTRREDQTTKRTLYQNTLRVQEYFLFDPFGDYLDPQLQGYRLHRGIYRPIRRLHGRLPSRVLGLHLQGAGDNLRLFDPQTGNYLPTPQELLAQTQQNLGQAEQRILGLQQQLTVHETEIRELRAALEELRRRLPPGS